MNHRVVSGFSITVVLLVLVGWYSYRSILDFRLTAERVSRSHQFVYELESLLTDVLSAESEVRGYYISGKPEYLKLYEEARAESISDMQSMRKLLPEAALAEDMEQLFNLVNLRLERMRVIVETRKQHSDTLVLGGPTGAELAKVGKQLMDQVRTVADRMKKAEMQALTQQANRLRRVAQQTTLVIAIGSALAVLFHLMSTVALSRSIAKRERLERSLLDVSEREQRRIGQDLHDGLCQQLTGISLMLKSFQINTNPQASAELGIMINLINQSIEETRIVTRGLHPVPDEPGGLVIGLKELADSIDSKGDLRCELSIQGADHINDTTISSNIYRIAQEAVRNALKHSEASLIRIVLSINGRRLAMRIEDNGNGWPIRPSRSGLGMEIMRYRASSIGGHLHIQPSPSSGVAVCYEMDLNSPAASPQTAV
jgi:signal transduction histidine kinase